MAKNEGKRFENNVKQSATQQGLLFERFKDSNKFGFSDKTRFTMDNPCDAFVFDGSTLYYIELKSTIGTSVSFNQPPTQKGGTCMIKAHQINSLLERSRYDGVYCGLLITYADRVNSKGAVIEGGTYFVEINDFVDWAGTVDKKSINKSDCEKIGIKVDAIKKKVNYSYNIRGLLKDILNRYNTI